VLPRRGRWSAAGANVGLAARRKERLDALTEELGAERVTAVVGDVRDAASSEALVESVVARWGRLDTVVANAGIGAYGGILDLEDEQLREMVETNYLGTVWTIRAGVRQLRAQGTGGDIVIISSVAGFRGGADEAVYAGTKHAQVGLGGSLDRELRGEGIRVTLVCPAGTSTEFAIGGGREAGSPVLDSHLRSGTSPMPCAASSSSPARCGPPCGSCAARSSRADDRPAACCRREPLLTRPRRTVGAFERGRDCSRSGSTRVRGEGCCAEPR
jgi:3-oxoacyl-[acyl-carrier protein] reductase